jgi:hypothetical protein
VPGGDHVPEAARHDSSEEVVVTKGPEEQDAASKLLDDLLAELNEEERYRYRRWAAKVANGLQFRPDEFDALKPGATIDGTPYLDAPIRNAVRSL